MVALLVCCLLLAFCSCRPVEKIVEVEKWQHDTTTVTDTIHVKDIVIQRDSIFKTEYITQFVKDSTQTNVAWKHYTYDKEGNVTSLLDYTSNTHHGSTANTATQSASTSESEQSAIHEETGAHSESSGHSDALKTKEQKKEGLTRWEKILIALGYCFIIFSVFGLTLFGMRLYGKYKKR